MGWTPRYGLRYLDVGEPLHLTRPALQDNAATIEGAMSAVADYVTQLAAYLGPAYGAQHHTYLGLDDEGVVYFDPDGTTENPQGVALDSDGVPYYFDFEEPTP